GPGPRGEAAVGVIVPEAAGAIPDGVVAAQMAPDHDAQPGAGPPAGLLGELQGDPVGRDDVVAAHHPLLLDAQDLVEVGCAEGNEGGGGIGGGPAKLGVEGGQEAVAQVAVGG